MARAKNIPMKALAREIEFAHDKGKYCVIFDKNENCPVFFTYKATMTDFHKEMIAVQIGQKTKEEALDVLRKGIVYSMRIGDTFVINTEALCADFKTEWTDESVFPSEEICEFDEWREDEKYMKIVKQEENKDLLGMENNYIIQDSFTMVFLS